MTPAPPNTPAAVLLVARLHAARLLNRLRSRMGRGIARTGIGGMIFAVLFGGLMMFNTGMQTSTLLRGLAAGYKYRGPVRVHATHGLVDQVFPVIKAWGRPGQGGQLAARLGEVLLLMACCRVCMGISSAYQDLGKVEGGMEWLFTMPISAGALCLAQVLAYTVIDPLGWVVAFPFLLVVFASTGMGWAAIPTALGAALYLGFAIGCCQSVLETMLRKTFSPAKLKNLQAGFALLGFLLFFSLILLARPDAGLMELLERSSPPPAAAVWNPFAAPLLLCLGEMPKWEAVTAGCVYTAFIALGAVALFERLMRSGLLANAAVYEGSRGGAGGVFKGGGFAFRGIIGKDLRLLLRDRNFLVQTLILPLVVVGYNVFFNAGVFKGAMTNFAYGATMAFGVGAYTLTSSAFAILAVEGNSLWMLYTFPRPLHSMLLEKTLLWTGVALVYTTCVLGYCAWSIPHLAWAAAPEAGMAVAGTVVYSFIAGGIGVLATDPMKAGTGRRRYRAGTVYLYLILAGLYGYALHSGGLWVQAGALAAAGLIARVLWRMVGARTPWLLDTAAR